MGKQESGEIISERRLQVADMTAQGLKPKEVAARLGYTPAGLSSALQSPAVKEQITWHRDNLFERSRIDRVKLLRRLYQDITCPTGPIFQTLRGEGDLLLASNLEKLKDEQSRLIQQVDVGQVTIRTGELDEQGEPVIRTVSVITKIRFHSADAAKKILAKAAGFEDGVDWEKMGQSGGPFRGMIIIPPDQYKAQQSSSDPDQDSDRSSGEGPPENPNSHSVEGSDSA